MAMDEQEMVVEDTAQAAAAAAAAINANAVLITVSVSALGVRRKVRATRAVIDGATVGSEIAERSVSLTKKLIACDEYDAITSLDRAFYLSMMQRVVSSKYRKGSYLLPVKLVDWFEAEYAAYRTRRDELVEAFLAVYAKRVEEAAQDLGPLFDSTDYPDIERVRDAFGVSRSYQQVGVPDKLAELSPSLFQEQKRELARETERAALEVRQALRAGMLQLVEHLRERLTPGEDGRPKRLHESTVEALRDWIELFSVRNITGDAPLAEMAEFVGSILEGVDRDTLKRDDEVRGVVSRSLDLAAQSIGEMVETVPRRSFNFDD